VPPAISLALHRTRAWWLIGAIMLGAAAYLALAHRGSDPDALFPDFEGIARTLAAAVLAVYAAVVLAITYLARAPRAPR
jgi:hypothetical protein